MFPFCYIWAVVQQAQRFQEMAKHGIYLKSERFLIKSFGYICKGLVLAHRHFMKPRNVGCKQITRKFKTTMKHSILLFFF
jgi:hypothetical protein